MTAPPRVLIVGATSAIAHAIARRYAARGATLHLLGRRADALADNAADLRVRGANEVTTAAFDAREPERFDAVLADAWSPHGGFDIVLVAWGVLPDQAASEASVEATLASFDVNARSTIALLTLVAARLQAAGSGVLGVISSVAGERGRASNYVYGAAKAAVSAFASGLRHRLHRDGVRVVTVLPGFVDTPMTAALPKGGPLWATPDRVARDIERALDGGFGTVYTPGFWRLVMAVVRALPERVFVRTKL